MEQKITHLVVQCGENHVSPLSKALSEILTGHNSSLYLPRIALAKLSPAQISSYFEMQDKYSKSLKSLALFPTLTNLDKPRKEYYEDGSIVERSTRDWATTIFLGQTDMSARSEVVNGGFDHKAYLLVPTQHFAVAQEHLRQYRLRLNPIGRREARFRDSLPGLPSVIHIDTSTQQNLDFLAQLSASDVWERAPPAVRTMSTNQAGDKNRSRQEQGKSPLEADHSAYKTNNKRVRNTSRLTSLGEGKEAHDEAKHIDLGHDDQTTSTKSATQSMATPSILSNATSRRLQELEALFRNQQTAIEDTAQLGKQMDSALQQTITTLQENSDKLVLTMERQQDTHVQLVELSTRVSRLTEVMDRMASQIETLTALTLSHQSPQFPRETSNDGNRRRPIEELSPHENPDEGPSTVSHDAAMKAGMEGLSHTFKSTLTNDKVQSPNKKKSRQHQDKSSDNLHSDLEEMSLGSDESDNAITTARMARSQQTTYIPDTAQLGIPLFDDASDDFSSATTEVMPDLDTQYKTTSDPEGGNSS
jgi:predicted  nucleic acid-binding Zn-ribbon protein